MSLIKLCFYSIYMCFFKTIVVTCSECRLEIFSILKLTELWNKLITTPISDENLPNRLYWKMYNNFIITYSEEYSLACINYPSDSILTWYPCVALTTPIGNSTERKPKVTKKKYFLFGENNKWNKVTNQVCWYDWKSNKIPKLPLPY